MGNTVGFQVPPPTPINHVETGELFSYSLFSCRDSVVKNLKIFL